LRPSTWLNSTRSTGSCSETRPSRLELKFSPTSGSEDCDLDQKIRIEDLPPDARAYLGAAYVRISNAMKDAISAHGLRPGLSRSMARARIALMDGEMSPIFTAMANTATPVACARGCGSCCTLTVEVSADELFALVSYLDETLDEASLAALKARARDNDAIGHGLEPLARHRKRLVCPVQDPTTKACLGHAARPNPCQGYVSVSLADCEADRANPPQRVERPAMSGILTDLVGGCRDQALAAAGMPKTRFELTAGLIAAWAEPGAEARWLAGEDVFPDARAYVAPGDT
jgi:Fe-S-cluster containining protein